MKILTIDDHVLFRRCMVDFLMEQESVNEVFEAASPQQGLDKARELQPNIVLVDIDLGGHDGLELAEEIVAECPDSAVVMLTADQSESQMLRAIQIGTRGYLLKDIVPEELIRKLQKALAGEMIFPADFLHQQVKNNLNKTTQGNQDKLSQGVLLTPREVEVLQGVTNGLTDRAVAEDLGVSENTVKNHMKNIRKKLGVSNRVQATMMAIEQGFVNKSSS